MRRRPPAPDRASVTCHGGHAIGIDIGATAVRAAMLRVRPDADGACVTMDQVAGVALAPGTVVNGVVQDAAALTQAVKHLWKSHDLGCRNVILGVSSPQVLVRDLRVPDLPPGQRERALPFQAREVIALPVEEAVLDFTPLGPPDPDTRMIDGLLVASPREPVLTAVNAVQRAGLKVVRVDLSSFALLRSAATGSDVEAVIDLGAHLTTIVIHRDGVPRLVRTLAEGGERLTTRLAERLDLSPLEAEEAKRAGGLAGHDEVSRALLEAIAPLLAQVRSSVNYFRSSSSGAPLQRISLTGGGAGLRGLPEVLGEQNDAPAVRTDPLQRVGLSDDNATLLADDLRWASALSTGLAMGVAA